MRSAALWILVTTAVPVPLHAQSPDKLAKDVEEVLVPIRGIVVDVDGRPIQGAGILIGAVNSLFTEDALKNPASRTDAKGRIRFQAPRYTYKHSASQPPFVLIARKGYACARVNLVTNHYPRSGLPQNTSPGYDLGRITLLKGGVLRGRVRGAAGRPLNGVRVVARDLLSSGYYARFINYYGVRHPVYESAGKTDDKGRFELTGVFPAGMCLVVKAPGYYDYNLPFVSSKHAIDVSMERSGFVEGRVVGGDGKPVDAMITVNYETSIAVNGQIRVPIHTKKDGRFRISLAGRGRYGMYVVGVLRPGETYRQVYSSSYTHPRNDVEIELAQPPETKKPITLEVVDKKTGKPVSTARAVVQWQDPRYLNTVSLESMFPANSRKSDKDGKIELRGPLNQQPPKGAVLVKAKGYAPFVEKKIEYDEEKPLVLKVELQTELVIRGVVVDEKTGKPMAGVRVSVSPQGMLNNAMGYDYRYTTGAQAQVGIVTDKDGRFRAGGLGPGKYEVSAKPDHQPKSKLLRLSLKNDGKGLDVRIEIPRGTSLSGRVFAGYDDKGGKAVVKLGRGWQARLGGSNQNNYNPWMNSRSSSIGFGWGYGGSLNQLSVPPVVLGADGSFKFDNLDAGRYRFNLMAPPIGKRGRTVLSAIEPLRIRKKDMARDFDISEDLPGIVRGKVKVIGVPFPMSRLFVLSVPVGEASGRPTRVYYNQMYFRCVVAEDGTFAFRANRGRHHIYIMDGANSTVLHHATELVNIEYGKTKHVDLSIPLAPLRIRLRPETEGGEIVVGRMEWMATHAGDATASFMQYDQGYGQRVEGQTELFLIVPPVKLRFVVRSYISAVDPMGRRGNVISGEGEVTAKMGVLETLVIKVRPPGEVTNAAPPKGEKEKTKKSEKKADPKKAKGGR